MVWAVVPVKQLARAKQRLSGLLGPEQRRLLCDAMLDDVLAALAAARGLAGILVVSSDPAARMLAMRHGARLLDDTGQGLNAAIAHAAGALAAEGAAAMLVIHGDAPLATADEIEALIAAHAAGHAVALAADRRGDGTNALLCAPPDTMSFHYGPGSFAAHREAARAAGHEPAVLDLPGLALDIDTADDLALFAERANAGAAYRLLVGQAMAPAVDARHDAVRKVV
jgi:2-phospho-L-lactate guanylyltransferase